MTTEIKGNQSIITLELIEPTISKSGKTLAVASTHGFTKTNAIVAGKPVSISVNAFIPLG